VVFSGPSGCGKTTLLHLIGTIEPASSGTILINGKDIRNRRNQEHVLKYDIGFLFQNFALVDKKTVRDNILLVPKICRSGIIVEEALDFVGLANLIDTRVYKLSGGEQQRVALARLLFKKCSIILADEPTGSLDDGNAAMVMDLLIKLKETGRTIVMVTHNAKQKKVADRVIEL
jgi:putative ABC transport system ATP-binding protein